MSIALNKITKLYNGQPILKDFDLEVQAGELFVLLGSSGSGKSTLLRIIAGLLPADGGQVLLHGKDVTDLTPQQRDTGFVFQNYSLFRHMTVAQNIAFALDIRNVPRNERDERVVELLSLIGMEEFGNRMPWQLSGGQQQRVALARALAHQPQVLLLDEPFGALDTKIRTQLRQNLRTLQQRFRVTTILVTHDQNEAFELADRIGIIDHGELLDLGTPSELYRRPHNRAAATFLGAANLFTGTYQRDKVILGTATLHIGVEGPDNQPVEVVCRPEEIELCSTPRTLHSPAIGRGIVQEVVFASPLQQVSVELCLTPDAAPILLNALLDADAVEAEGIRPGKQVWVGIKHYHVLPWQAQSGS